MQESTYTRLLKKVRKKFLGAAAVIIVLGTLVEFPNPITHRCVPNLRTHMHLSSAGYPTKHFFCPEGYYPSLRWGEDVLNRAWVEVFFVAVPLGLVLPTLFILTRKEAKS